MTKRLFGIALLTGFLFVNAYDAQAQTTFGVRGGISVANASLDVGQDFDKSNRTGYVGGVFLDWASSGLFGFQVAAQYVQKGVELDINSVKSDFDLAYLEVPIVAKLGLPVGPIRPSVFGGAALGFKTACEDASGDDCGENVKGTEWSGVAGADLAIYIGGISLWADARYHFGLSNISKDALIQEAKNRNWTLQVGLGF